MFSMIWSICCSVDEEGRKKIDAYLREIDGTFPNKDSIYEYYVEPKTRSWIHWEEKLKQGWKLNPRFIFNHPSFMCRLATDLCCLISCLIIMILDNHELNHYNSSTLMVIIEIVSHAGCRIICCMIPISLPFFLYDIVCTYYRFCIVYFF